ncbi:MAG: BON domain-containing protein [Chitinophagaceae bacterium]|nr:MAG: BON domain-containing protein [Chitinophagaceae bacterium]
MKNDSEIQQAVMTELKWQPFLTASAIGVAVKNGIVTLSGTVDNYSQKLAAERAAKKVVGVKAIAEDIQIGVSPFYQKTDTDIAQSVANALDWHSAVPTGKVKAKVENGTVTLEGEVEWDFQRDSAKNAVSTLLGVRNVVNLVTVKSKVIAKDVNSKISAALHRAATVDAEKIMVETDGGTVRLRGAVRSYAEKEDAEEAAWCAPGVTRVENNLYVETELEMAF